MLPIFVGFGCPTGVCTAVTDLAAVLALDAGFAAGFAFAAGFPFGASPSVAAVDVFFFFSFGDGFFCLVLGFAAGFFPRGVFLPATAGATAPQPANGGIGDTRVTNDLAVTNVSPPPCCLCPLLFCAGGFLAAGLTFGGAGAVRPAAGFLLAVLFGGANKLGPIR